MERTQWEYWVYVAGGGEVDSLRGRDVDALATTLKAAGDNAWELVSVMPIPQASYFLLFIFKRPALPM